MTHQGFIPSHWVPIAPARARQLRVWGGWFAMLIGSAAVVLAVLTLVLGGRFTAIYSLIRWILYVFVLGLDVLLALTGFLGLNPWRHLRGAHIDLLLVRRTRLMLGVVWGLMAVLALGASFFLLGVVNAELRMSGQLDVGEWLFVAVVYLPLVLQGVAAVVGWRLYPRPYL